MIAIYAVACIANGMIAALAYHYGYRRGLEDGARRVRNGLKAVRARREGMGWAA